MLINNVINKQVLMRLPESAQNGYKMLSAIILLNIHKAEHHK
jgi:hypothetical protein